MPGPAQIPKAACRWIDLDVDEGCVQDQADRMIIAIDFIGPQSAIAIYHVDIL